MKVMILDDDPVILIMMSFFFQKRGYEVFTYANPTECPLYTNESCPCSLKDHCPNVIITDYDMPKANGVDFLEALRRKGCKCFNLALISGYSITDIAVEHETNYGVKFFAKPFHWKQIDDWLDQVETSLKQEQQANGAPPLLRQLDRTPAAPH